MVDKLAKNPKVMFWLVAGLVILMVAYIWDEKKNPDKDFYGILKSSTPAVQ